MTVVVVIVFGFDMVRGSECNLAEQGLDMPAILMTPGTGVPEYLKNPDLWREWIEDMRGTPLPADFRDVALKFKEEGERLGVFWPGVLVQSIHETGYYRYGGRARAENFNVGGVGITLEERTTTRQDFFTLRSGVRAMLEHLAIYADPYRMENIIRRQNWERGGRFTANRTEQVLSTIREKYDTFRRNNPDRVVKFKDLGPQVSDKKLKEHKDFAKYGLIRQLIGGATLGYAGEKNPFYAAEWYLLWRKAATDLCQLHQKQQQETGAIKPPPFVGMSPERLGKADIGFICPPYGGVERLYNHAGRLWSRESDWRIFYRPTASGYQVFHIDAPDKVLKTLKFVGIEEFKDSRGRVESRVYWYEVFNASGKKIGKCYRKKSGG